MGQYYTPYVIDENNSVRVFTPDSLSMGAKLTEHGFITSKLVNAVLYRILNRPRRVVWVGDYALDDESLSAERREKLIELTKYNGNMSFPRLLHINELKDCYGLYLINHTKKEYINMTRYIERCTRVFLWSQKESDDLTLTSMTTYCLSPLALLTAVGNGMGGGDYSGSEEESVGRWAFDLIEVRKATARELDGYEEIRPRFVGDWMEK